MPAEDLYVFGYGSLIWNPGFAFAEALPARLNGWHRRFCIPSAHYRGTPQEPGLVLGLAPGGACRGIAFRITPAQAEAALKYLDARENPNGEAVYIRRPVWLRLLGAATAKHPAPANGTAQTPATRVRALAYVANPAHPHLRFDLTPQQIARIIGDCHGCAGSNRDYLLNTARQLAALGLRDAALDRLAGLLDCAEASDLAAFSVPSTENLTQAAK